MAEVGIQEGVDAAEPAGAAAGAERVAAAAGAEELVTEKTEAEGCQVRAWLLTP